MQELLNRKRRDELCEQRVILFEQYKNGEFSRERYFELLKPLDEEIDAIEMSILDNLTLEKLTAMLEKNRDRVDLS